MEQIEFTVSGGKKIIINDCNTSEIASSAKPIYLLNFDGNSLSINYDKAQRLGADGIGIYDYKAAERTLKLQIGMIAKTNTKNAMYQLRRTVLRCFPPGIVGTLCYTNGNNRYEIDCFVNEFPMAEKICGALCTTEIYFTAAQPFWRQIGTPFEINALAGMTIELEFNSDTDVPCPTAISFCADTTLSGNNTYSALLEISGYSYDLNYTDFDIIAGKPVNKLKLKKTVNYLTAYPNVGENINIDWGIVGRANIKNLAAIDLIRSNRLMIYPGNNTIKLQNNCSGGTIKARIANISYKWGV